MPDRRRNRDDLTSRPQLGRWCRAANSTIGSCSYGNWALLPWGDIGRQRRDGRKLQFLREIPV